MERAIANGFTKVGESAKEASKQYSDFMEKMEKNANLPSTLVHKVDLAEKKRRREKGKRAKKARKLNR